MHRRCYPSTKVYVGSEMTGYVPESRRKVLTICELRATTVLTLDHGLTFADYMDMQEHANRTFTKKRRLILNASCV